MGKLKKALIILLIILVGGYFYAGYYVFGIAGSVPCAVWEGEQNNTPSNFSVPDGYEDSDSGIFIEYNVDPKPYFIRSYETVTIPSDEGAIELSAWWMERNPKGPTVMLIHGLTSSKYSSGILLSAGILYHEGFNILAIDMRDHGDSTCEDGFYSAGQKESDDSAASLKWLVEEKGISPSNIGIYGQSLGALTALTTPAKSNNFAAIAVHDPPVDFETLVKEEMVYQGFPPFLFYPTAHYSQIFMGVNITEVVPATALPLGNKQPILIFNGMLDERVLAHHTDDLIKIANENDIDVEAYRYEDMRHVQSIWVYTDEFSEAIVSFFQRNLSS